MLDSARTRDDTTYADIAFYQNRTSFFEKYYSVPYKHFKLNLLTIDSVDFDIRNLDNITQTANDLYTLVYNASNILDSIPAGGDNILPFEKRNFLFNYNDLLGTGFTSQLPSVFHDSTQLTIKKYLKAFETIDREWFRYNDTITYTQNFYNYYAYDDGTPESGLSTVQSGFKFALRVDALTEDTLRGISAFFNQYYDFGTADEAVFSICVWTDSLDKPNRLIYHEDNINPKYNSRNQIFSTYKFTEPVAVDSSFYIGFISSSEKMYSIGYDMSSDNQNQVFYSSGSSWSPLNVGHPMLRAIMGDDFNDVNIEQINAETNLKIYPNPAFENLIIELSTSKNQIKRLESIQIYNLTGKLVKYIQSPELEMLSNNNNSSININISDLPKGVYVINIGVEGNDRMYQKFIKE
jgi:hypothetical protein